MFDEIFPRKNLDSILPLSEGFVRRWDKPTVTMKVSSLEPSCPYVEGVVKSITNSIEEVGFLHYPLVVVEIWSRDWELERQTINPDIFPPPREGRLYRVQCGNNRLEAVKRLGYKYVPCALFSSIKHAGEFCKQWRKDKTWLHLKTQTSQ